MYSSVVDLIQPLLGALVAQFAWIIFAWEMRSMRLLSEACLEKKHLLLRIVCLKSDSYSSRNTPKPYNPNFTRDSPEKLALLDVFMYLRICLCMAFTKYFSRILVHFLSLTVQVAFFKHSIHVVCIEYFRHLCFIVT